MNNWQYEYMAEYHRQDILKEVEHIRLERLAIEASRSRSCPTLFERSLFTFANWMISRGRQLRKRYEATAVNCGNPPRVASQINR
jgi:hypothetical protein